MTGYGSAQATGSRLSAEVEIRSVNARSLKPSFRTPSFLSAREPDLEKLLRARVRRGTVNCFVRIQLREADDVIRVRPEVIEGLATALAPLDQVDRPAHREPAVERHGVEHRARVALAPPRQPEGELEALGHEPRVVYARAP